MKKIKRYSININLAKKIEDLLLGKIYFFLGTLILAQLICKILLKEKIL